MVLLDVWRLFVILLYVSRPSIQKPRSFPSTLAKQGWILTAAATVPTHTLLGPAKAELEHHGELILKLVAINGRCRRSRFITAVASTFGVHVEAPR